MISVVIPAWNAESTLTATLSALIPAVVDGVVREVIVVDGNSQDGTRAIADAAGARVFDSTKGRGVQMKAGGKVARHPWLLFLHADTVLEANWHHEVERFIERAEAVERQSKAAVFRFALSDDGTMPRAVEWGVNLRCRIFALPYGDQGLLISRALYDEVGGYNPMPLFEDVDIVRRLGRRRIQRLRAKATTSAVRFRNGGYTLRVLRNWWCVLLYYCGASPERLKKIYNG
jgi:rSAM/selenodomain-associated transferase 2